MAMWYTFQTLHLARVKNLTPTEFAKRFIYKE